MFAKMMSFSQLPAAKRYHFVEHAYKQIFGPSYFVTALAPSNAVSLPRHLQYDVTRDIVLLFTPWGQGDISVTHGKMDFCGKK